MSDTYSIGDIADAHGEKPRTVQFWSDAGVLKPIGDSNRRGKGTHRRFDETEMRLAGLAKRLAAMSCPVGELALICDFARSFTYFNTINPFHELHKSIRQLHSRRQIDDLTAAEFLSDLMSRVGVAGIYNGQIQLVVRYFFFGGDLRIIMSFLPDDMSKDIISDIISHKWKENYIGSKSIPVDVDRDLRFGYSLTQDERVSCQQIFLDAARDAMEVLDKVEQPLGQGA